MASISRKLLAGVATLAASAMLPATGSAQPKVEIKTTPTQPPAAPRSDAKKDQAPAVTRGASWSDKPRKRRRFRRRKRFDPALPYATFPGFRMARDGTSELWVHVTKKIPVDVQQSKGRVTFVLTGARVHVFNNTRPLVTTHFPTPVSVARLVRSADGAHLVVELRDKVKVTHRVVDGPAGTMVLIVGLPKPTRSFVVERRSSRDERVLPRRGAGSRAGSRRSGSRIGPER